MLLMSLQRMTDGGHHPGELIKSLQPIEQHLMKK